MRKPRVREGYAEKAGRSTRGGRRRRLQRSANHQSFSRWAQAGHGRFERRTWPSDYGQR